MLICVVYIWLLIFKVVTLEVRVLSHVMFEFEVLEYIILVEVLNL